MSTTVVLDTNVVLDLWHFHDSRAEGLRVALTAQNLCVVTSAALDAELNDVLSRPAFCESAQRIFIHWQALTHRIDVQRQAPWRCRDRNDQMLLDLAFWARAQFLLTRDKALLALKHQAAAHALRIAEPDTVVFTGTAAA